MRFLQLHQVPRPCKDWTLTSYFCFKPSSTRSVWSLFLKKSCNVCFHSLFSSLSDCNGKWKRACHIHRHSGAVWASVSSSRTAGIWTSDLLSYSRSFMILKLSTILPNKILQLWRIWIVTDSQNIRPVVFTRLNQEPLFISDVIAQISAASQLGGGSARGSQEPHGKLPVCLRRRFG